jgi:hypothetical protein
VTKADRGPKGTSGVTSGIIFAEIVGANLIRDDAEIRVRGDGWLRRAHVRAGRGTVSAPQGLSVLCPQLGVHQRADGLRTGSLRAAIPADTDPKHPEESMMLDGGYRIRLCVSSRTGRGSPALGERRERAAIHGRITRTGSNVRRPGFHPGAGRGVSAPSQPLQEIAARLLGRSRRLNAARLAQRLMKVPTNTVGTSTLGAGGLAMRPIGDESGGHQEPEINMKFERGVPRGRFNRREYAKRSSRWPRLATKTVDLETSNSTRS